MANPQINGVDFLATIIPIGDYVFVRAPLRNSLGGVGYRAGMQKATWTFTQLQPIEFDWLARWVPNAISASYPFVLWTDSTRRTLMSFTSGEILFPTFKSVIAGSYQQVVLEVDWLMPLLGTP